LGTPHLSTIMGPRNEWCTTRREKHWHKDYGKVIKCTCSRTEDTNQKDHLDEQAKIARTRLLSGWLHKIRHNKKNHKPDQSNYRGHLTYQKEVKQNR